jgi:L-lactate dehydrogenase complex protein LldG
MSAREEILNRLRQKNHSAPKVGSWVHQSNYLDLVAQFSQALASAKGEVLTAKNLESALEVLDGVLLELGARQVVFNQEPPLEEELLTEKLPDYQWEVAQGNEQEIRQLCLNAEVGLTSANFALAETGSVGIASGPAHSRMVSLLPPVHVVLLSEKFLVVDLISWERSRPKIMPSQIVLVSGPSKTADIEQTLVVGAHGPKKLIVIVYGEA